MFLRTITPSVSHASAKWQYKEFNNETWQDDPALTVTRLTEKPSYCEVTISLSKGQSYFRCLEYFVLFNLNNNLIVLLMKVCDEAMSLN